MWSTRQSVEGGHVPTEANRNSTPRERRRGRTLAGVALLAGVVGLPAHAMAVDRTCGADPIANTSTVLCAAPSGPCDAATVQLSANIDIPSGSCTFDLGGRALTVTQTLQVTAANSIAVQNAGDITISSTGRLKARGDFGPPVGILHMGGTILLASSGAVAHSGLIDVFGDSAGIVGITAAGDVTIHPAGAIRGVGDNWAADGTERLADGGTLNVTSSGGTIRVYGDITMTGQSQAVGGDVRLQAARNIEVTQPILASGGAGGGGSIEMLAGDDITITKTLDAESRAGGGAGGEIVLEAGKDVLGGVVTGGTLGVDYGTMKLNGSGLDDNDDDGGSLRAVARGDVLLGQNATVFANAAIGATGNGGTIEFDAGDTGDVTIEAPIHAISGSDGGSGGTVTAFAGHDVSLAVTADLTLNGQETGGTFSVLSGGAFTQASKVYANGLAPSGAGGRCEVEACSVAVNSAARMETTGTTGGQIALTARGPMTVSANSNVRATGTAGDIDLIVRSFGTCSNNPATHCLTPADCTVGCNTGQCLNVNPDTGGTASQFDPAPSFIEDPALLACP
jgi:hypothetical protein